MKASKKSAGASLRVLPPEGWNVHSQFGVLKTQEGQCLVRLEDVHAFLMHRDGLSSASAAARVFAAFLSDAGSEIGMLHGVEKARECLYVVDQAEYASPIASMAGRMFVERAAGSLPHLPNAHFERGTAGAFFYSLSVMAGEVWSPHVKHEQLADRLFGDYPEGPAPSLSVFQGIAGRFAVSLPIAHVLWGWGRVEKPTAQVMPLRASACSPGDVKDWPSLVLYRSGFSESPAQKRPEWLSRHVEILAAHIRQAIEGKERGVTGRVGADLGMRRQAVEALLKRNGYTTKGQRLTTAFDGLRHVAS